MNAMTKVSRPHNAKDTAQMVRGLGGELLTMAAISRWTGLHRATIYRMIAAGAFPAGKATGANSRRWTRREVLDWVEAR